MLLCTAKAISSDTKGARKVLCVIKSNLLYLTLLPSSNDHSRICEQQGALVHVIFLKFLHVLLKQQFFAFPSLKLLQINIGKKSFSGAQRPDIS